MSAVYCDIYSVADSEAFYKGVEALSLLRFCNTKFLWVSN